MFRIFAYAALGLALFLSACGPASPNPMMVAVPTTNSATPGAGNSAMPPAWLATKFTDVRDGQDFTVTGYQGRVVLVEMMAVWCTNCFAQQGQIAALHKLLGAQPDLLTVSLDVDASEDPPTLKAYVSKTGFDWIYAVAPPEVTHDIGQLYGDQFLNPSATPILIVDRHGIAHPLPFGIKSAEDLMKAVKPYLEQGM